MVKTGYILTIVNESLVAFISSLKYLCLVTNSHDLVVVYKWNFHKSLFDSGETKTAEPPLPGLKLKSKGAILIICKIDYNK
jgi:hypothetical protein